MMRVRPGATSALIRKAPSSESDVLRNQGSDKEEEGTKRVILDPVFGSRIISILQTLRKQYLDASLLTTALEKLLLS